MIEESITYPLYDLEFDTGQVISPMVYTNHEWHSKYSITPVLPQRNARGHFVMKSQAKLYSDLFDKRHKGDYNDFFDHDEVSVLRLYPISKQFVDKIKELVASTP